MRMDAAQSCELDQLALFQTGKGFAHIDSNRGLVGIVIVCQRLHDFGYGAAIAADKNFVRGFI